MSDRVLGDAFGVLSCPFWSTVLQCGARLPMHTFNHWTYAPPRCRPSEYRRIFITLSVSLWYDLTDPVFDGVGLADFKRRANAFFVGLSCSIPTMVFYSFPLSPLSVSRFLLWGWGLQTDKVYITLLALHCRPLLIIIIIILIIIIIIIIIIISSVLKIHFSETTSN